MRKSISNRDNLSDRIMRRVVARRDSTNRTQNQHITSVGACSASTTHTKIPVIERSRNAGFFCKKEGSKLRRFGYRLVGALRLRSVTGIFLKCCVWTGVGQIKKPDFKNEIWLCAQDESRTHTSLRPLPPQSSVSTIPPPARGDL